MKKLLVLSAILAALVCCRTSYGMGGDFKFPVLRVLVYKGTIKTTSVFDVNNTNKYVSATLQGYWAINVSNTEGAGMTKGLPLSSCAMIYNPKTKNYKILPAWTYLDPYDPCHIAMMKFYVTDREGILSFNATGKGKLTKYSNDPNDPNHGKDYVIPAFKGTGQFENYDLFEPNKTWSGTFAVSLKLDPKLTAFYNPDVSKLNTDVNDINDVIYEIADAVTSKGDSNDWTKWPYHPASLPYPPSLLIQMPSPF